MITKTPKIPNGPGFSPRTSARSAAWPSAQLACVRHRGGPDLHFGLAEQRMARQRADPDRAEPAVLAELEGVVAQQHGRPGQGQGDLAAAVPALITEGVDGAKHYPCRGGA